MSEDETGHRPARLWHFFLDDMVAFAEDALSYTAGMDQSGFESNGLVFDATLRKLELIGEAARKRSGRDPHPCAWYTLATDHRNPEPDRSCLPGHRQRHDLEHPAGRSARADRGRRGPQAEAGVPGAFGEVGVRPTHDGGSTGPARKPNRAEGGAPTGHWHSPVRAA